MKLSSYPFVRLSFFLGVGIFLQDQLHLNGTILSAAFPFFAFSYLIWIRFFRSWLNTAFPGMLAYSAIIALGAGVHYFHHDLHDTAHFSHQPEGLAFQVVIESPPRQSASGRRYLGDLIAVRSDSSGWINSSGNVSLFFTGDQHELWPGEVLVVSGFPKPVNGPRNPYEFNYARYLATKNIHYQAFIRPGDYVCLGTVARPIKKSARKAQKWVEGQFDKWIEDPNSNALAKALVLGNRKEVDAEVQDIFVHTGVMHILAVSGLHVGIILGVLIWTLGFLKRAKGGAFLFAFVSIIILWFFAWLTGLSPSVLRAVTMFSLLLIGQAINRDHQSINAVAASAFFLLLADPGFLFQIGFQLSYAAVFSIIILYPAISGWFTFNHVLPERAWQLASVSLAAQVGTLPFTLLYFGQFPTYFLISNIIAVPLGTLLLILAMTVLGSFWFPFLASMIAFLFQGTAGIMIYLLDKISGLPASIVQGIYLTSMEATLLFACILVFAVMFMLRQRSMVWVSLGLLIFFALSRIYTFYDRQTTRELVVYAGRNLIVDVFDQGNLYSNGADTDNYAIERNRIGYPAPVSLPDSYKAGTSIFQFKDISTAIISDSSTIAGDFPFDILIFTGLPPELPEFRFDNTQVICNLPYYQQNRFEQWLQGRPYHDLRSSAFTMEIK